MQSALFVQSSNAISNLSASTTFGGQVWNQLQELKEVVTQELLDEGPLCQSEPDDNRDGAAAGDTRDIDWRHRSQLEASLRDITDAQDRLFDGKYGKCIECGEQISFARLAADPVASLCLGCQRINETETVFPTL